MRKIKEVKKKKMRSKKATGILLLLIAILVVSVFTAAIPGIASESSNTKVTIDISSASKSILQIEKLKSNLTDAQKKLSTDLLQLVNSNFLPPGQTRETLEMQMKNLGQFRPASSVSPKADGRVGGDLVYVYIYLKPPAGIQTIEPYVWEVTDRDEENHLAVAWMEVKDLETLASLGAVRTIRTVMPPLVRTGSVTTEGDTIHRTSDVRTTYSQSGSGVKVGIISDGVDHCTDAQSSGDLPAGLTILSNTQGGDEGTAMLEIVHDMVPDADLYFHDCGDNVVAFNNAIDALVTAGCNVICDDIGWIFEPFFEDGIVASHLTSVLASNDIIYASSAGNNGRGHYQGDYHNDGNNSHDKVWYIDFYPPFSSAIIVLQWNDAFGASGNDYDLYLCDYDTEEVLLYSANTQDGDDDPLEFIWVDYDGSFIGETVIKVANRNGIAATKTLEVFIHPIDNVLVYADNIDPVDSIFGHAAVPNAIAVGAINASDPGNDDIELFSSQGPVTISYPSPVSRPKPDLCGIDGVTVTGAGGFPSPFYGTSAAAPHIAAIAAQLWGAFPAKTRDEIRTTLCSSAVDLGSTGYDNVFGYGRADALNAFEALAQRGIWVEPTSFDVTLLENTSEDYTLKIGNDGNATLAYKITDNSPWLDENPKSGSVEPSTYDNITVSINTTGLLVGEYNANVNITSNDNESVITVPVHLTVTGIFDTGAPTNPYPSIFGTHNGTITPNQTINVSKMYTYPCKETGGHSEYVAFYSTDTAGTGTVLIIDDNDVHFRDDQSVDIFSTTFKDMGYDVTIEESDETSYSTWSDYDIVVWSCGDDLTPIYDRPPNPEYKKMLVDYVTDGGHLILESGHIATWIKRFGDQAMDYELRKKVLHATTDWVYCDVGNLTVSAPDHPVATTPNALPDTIGFTPTNPGDDSGDADAVRILPNATGVYNWSYVKYGGNPVKESVARISYGLIAYDNDADVTNGGQIIYYAFDIDDIDNNSTQRELIENSENWLRVVKGAEIANGTWNGYQGAGDYHYIVFEKSFTLEKDVTYNYAIRTGSYPQIHHADALPTANGWINCTKFTDANGKEYTDWIPAIRLE